MRLIPRSCLYGKYESRARDGNRGKPLVSQLCLKCQHVYNSAFWDMCLFTFLLKVRWEDGCHPHVCMFNMKGYRGVWGHETGHDSCRIFWLLHVITLFGSPMYSAINPLMWLGLLSSLGASQLRSQQLSSPKPRQMEGHRRKPTADCEDRDDLICRFEMIQK